MPRSCLPGSCLATITLAILACGDQEDQPDLPSLDQTVCPDASILSWENVGEPYLLTWCTGCHSSNLAQADRQSAPTSVNFDGIDDVQRYRERIHARIEDATMPPVGSPDLVQRQQMATWLACGAPTNDQLNAE